MGEWANGRQKFSIAPLTPSPFRPFHSLVPRLSNMNPSDGRLLVIAGPCVIESRELCLRVGEFVRDACARLNFNYVFKASFDKANRSSGDSFRGPGMEEGLKILDNVRKELGVPVLTDVH